MVKVWEREGYRVVEKYAGQFEVIKDDGEVVGTIVTETAEDREQIIADLDAGEDVNGWEDGAGNTIYVEEEEMR